MNEETRKAARCAIWLLLALLFVPAAPARAQVLRVQTIEIRGNQRINEPTIRTAISTKEGDVASPERIERDRLDVLRLGWFRSVIVNPQRSGNMVNLAFIVTEYPVVQQIDITGSSIFTDAQLRAAMKTTTGEVFNRTQWDADVRALDKLYTDKGYVVGILDTANQEAPDFLDRGILRVEIRELKVGTLDLKWPTREIKDKNDNVVRTEEQHKTKNYVVERELSQRPGALFNSEQINRDYKALSALGFFETINPVVTIDRANETASVTWELTERRTGQVSVGAGYSPRQQLIGRAELADQNFRGKGQSVSVAGEIGTFGGDGAPSLELQFYEPWLTPTRTSMSVSLYNKLVYRFSRGLSDRDFRNRDDRYFERRMGGQLQFGRPFQWPVTLGFRYDDVDTGDLPRNLQNQFPQQDGRVIAGNLSRVINTRDYPQNPTEGTFARLITEFGHSSLDQSNTNTFDSAFFNKVIVDYRRYFRLKGLKAVKEPDREQEAQKVPVIATRLMAGTVIGKVPFFEQFFMGGAESLRGYLEDRFWGNHMYLASVEYRRPIMKSIVGVLFADVGDAFGSESIFQFRGNRFQQHDDIRPSGSVGVGLRVQTPIGPIRLDVGYGEEGTRSHFSIGHAF